MIYFKEIIKCGFYIYPEKSPKAADKIIDKRNIAESGKDNTVMGSLDTPIGTKFGEKLSPKSLHSGGTGLPPLNGSASDNDIGQLPPLQGKFF